MKRNILFIILAISPLFSWATDAIDAKVTRAGVYGNGKLFVVLDTNIPQTECVSKRFDVSPDHPQIERWLSIALAAAASESLIRVRTNGCLGGYPTMDNTTNSFFYYKKG